MLTDARYYELLEEATVDCYGEEEEFSGIMCTLVDSLAFPLRATLAGAPVTVQAIDGERSSLRRGVVARVERKGQLHHVGLAELVFVDPDPDSAEWIEMHRRWSESR